MIFMNPNELVPVFLRLTKSQRDKLGENAKKIGVSVSSLVRIAVSEYLRGEV
jgi:hypothetical protein